MNYDQFIHLFMEFVRNLYLLNKFKIQDSKFKIQN